MDTLQSYSYEKSPNISVSCDHPSDRFPECTTRIILFYTILDIRTNIKRGCSSHIRRYKIACGLIESIKRSARARSFPFFTTEIWESIPPYIDIYIYHRLSTTDHGDIWSGHGPPVVGVTNLQIDLNRSSTIMLDN